MPACWLGAKHDHTIFTCSDIILKDYVILITCIIPPQCRHQNIPGRMIGCGNFLPLSPPLLVTHKKSHHFYPTHMLYLSHICTLPLGDPKSVCAKKFERKCEKNTTLCRLPNAFDPANRGIKRMRIEPTMVNFRMGHCQLTARMQSSFPIRKWRHWEADTVGIGAKSAPENVMFISWIG